MKYSKKPRPVGPGVAPHPHEKSTKCLPRIVFFSCPVGDEPESGSIEVKAGAASAAGMAELSFQTAHREALIQIDGGDFMRAWHSGDPRSLFVEEGSTPLVVPIAPGTHSVKVRLPQTGYSEYKADLTLAAGDVATIHGDLYMYWGASSSTEGRVFSWIYDHIFVPCNSTMFALLADASLAALSLF